MDKQLSDLLRPFFDVFPTHPLRPWAASLGSDVRRLWSECTDPMLLIALVTVLAYRSTDEERRRLLDGVFRALGARMIVYTPQKERHVSRRDLEEMFKSWRRSEGVLSPDVLRRLRSEITAEDLERIS